MSIENNIKKFTGYSYSEPPQTNAHLMASPTHAEVEAEVEGTLAAAAPGHGPLLGFWINNKRVVGGGSAPTPPNCRPKGLRKVGLWASPRLRLRIAVGKYYY